MPLIVLCGLPASGKSKRSKELKEYFESRNKNVHVISENVAIPKAGYHKNECFTDDQKEKVIRSDLKSQVLRLLDKTAVVILDAGNYIKGYRYELFCAIKSISGTQCCIFCGIDKQQAWEFNLQRTAIESNDTNIELDNSNVPYNQQIFDSLCMRFEEPHGNCRWDSPLFVCFPDDTLPFDNIYAALFESKPLPPNQSTQNPPLSSTNYLYELDRITNEIINDIIAARKIGILGEVPIKQSEIKVKVPQQINVIHLNRLRRQYLNYSKLHTTTAGNLDNVPQLFVQFLNSNLNELHK